MGWTPATGVCPPLQATWRCKPCCMPIRSASSSAQAEAAWPPLLTIARAVAYTGCSRSTLGRAIKRGDLPLYGRAGGPRGQRVLRREDLDRWMRGDVGASGRGVDRSAGLRVERSLIGDSL